MNKIKWGIVGPGIIAHEFAHDFAFSRYGKLHAVASRSQARADEFAQKYHIPKAYGAYQDLYNDPEVDAIYVATPHNFHFEISRDALRAGKAVLCEKPLTVTPDECEQLMEVAAQTGNYLIEGMWTYFLPAIKKAQQWVAERRIGKILHIKADFGYPISYKPEGRMYNPDLAGGTMHDLGVYTIAAAWLFYQQDPLHMTVVARNAPTGVENDMTMLFEYKDAAASLCTSFRCKLHNYLYIIGEHGYIEVPDFWRARESFLYEMETPIEHFIDNRKGFGFEYEIDAVSRDIATDLLESKVVPLATSLKVQQHMYQALAKVRKPLADLSLSN